MPAWLRPFATKYSARTALEGGESQVGRLKITLVAWMDRLLKGPWDEAYFELRCRIGRVHVRIALPQHYMFGAMNVLRNELCIFIEQHYMDRPAELGRSLQIASHSRGSPLAARFVKSRNHSSSLMCSAYSCAAS